MNRSFPPRAVALHLIDTDRDRVDERKRLRQHLARSGDNTPALAKVAYRQADPLS